MAVCSLTFIRRVAPSSATYGFSQNSAGLFFRGGHNAAQMNMRMFG